MGSNENQFFRKSFEKSLNLINCSSSKERIYEEKKKIFYMKFR